MPSIEELNQQIYDQEMNLINLHQEADQLESEMQGYHEQEQKMSHSGEFVEQVDTYKKLMENIYRVSKLLQILHVKGRQCYTQLDFTKRQYEIAIVRIKQQIGESHNDPLAEPKSSEESLFSLEVQQ